MAATHNQKSLRALLENNGWSAERGGKHALKMTKAGRRPITLPMHKGGDYAPGLTARILKQAGLR
ncbi:MAG TPA: type II toxin-antitoxin system HicA family toxin [Gaiellaceae bacterium]